MKAAGSTSSIEAAAEAQVPLETALLQSLPWLSARGRAAINFLIYDHGRSSSAEALAARLGLSTRYQLARLLRREGLPTYETLTGWISTLYWRSEAEHSHATLVLLARRSHRALAASYRLVLRVTGRRWSELRRASLDELLRHFVAQCASRPRRPTKGAHDDLTTINGRRGTPTPFSPESHPS